MYGRLSAVILLLASAVFAQNQTCQNGGSPTGNNQAPCYCPPPFYGMYCEYSLNTTSTVSPPNNATSSWNSNPSTTAGPSGNSTNCLNGGIQIGAFCYCREPYYGDRCQYPPNASSTVFPPNNATSPWSNNGSATSYPWNNNGSATSDPWNNNASISPSSWSNNGSAATSYPWSNNGTVTPTPWNNNASISPSSWSNNGSAATSYPWSNNGTVTPTPWNNNASISPSSWSSNASTTASPSGNSTNCLNGGIQIGAFCYCREPYYGDRCQYNGGGSIRRVRSVDNRHHRALMDEVIEEVLEQIDHENDQQ